LVVGHNYHGGFDDEHEPVPAADGRRRPRRRHFSGRLRLRHPHHDNPRNHHHGTSGRDGTVQLDDDNHVAQRHVVLVEHDDHDTGSTHHVDHDDDAPDGQLSPTVN